MDYEAIAAPYQDNAVDAIERQDGVIDILPRLSLFLSDEDLIANLNGRIEDSVDYWDDIQGYNLKYARAQSARMVIGKQIDTSKLYRYQIPYIDNEVHVAIDTIISYVTAQTPRPEVYPAQSTEKAKILARDVEKAMYAFSETHDLSVVFEEALYGTLVKRVGFIKLYYDPELDDIVVRAVNPDWVIVDKNARRGENPGFICEIHKDTAENLVLMFPKKKQQIFDMLKIKQGTPKQMTQELVWREVHATCYDRGDQQEVVFCYIKNLMLSKTKDTNWLYDQDGGRLKNFLNAPMKNYIPLNYLNSGAHWIDETTPIEQAYSMQDVLNKRGRQIMENADTANGFLALSDEAITMDDAENLTGDPNQKFVIKTAGRPISEFIMQVPPHMLPPYVVADKSDIRATLHNLMGTPPQMSGADGEGKDNTLGEAIMIKNQASGRQDRLARCVERAAKQVFNMLAQMMRVHYTGKHWFVYNGGNGDFDHVMLTRHMIDEGMQIHVGEGTTLPFDKSREEAVAMNLAKMDKISPLDLYKDLHMDNPQQRYDNWVKYKTDPMSLARDVELQSQDGQAEVEFVEAMAGNKVKPFDEASMDHIKSHRKQMLRDEFLKAKRPRQNALLDLIDEETKSLELRTQLDMMSAPQQAGASGPSVPNQSMPTGAPVAGAPPMAPPGAPPTIAGIMGAQGGVPQPQAAPNLNLANPGQLPLV